MIYFISDLHFCHNRDFIYEPRGFSSTEDMAETIIRNWNNVVTDEDEVYILGDIILNDNEKGMSYLKRLNGKSFHIILGNHDTDKRVALYREYNKITDIQYATIIKYGKWHFYLSHYPTLTANFDEKSAREHLINIFGHTHSKDKFYEDNPYMYNVACDSNNCTPVAIDSIIADIRKKVISSDCVKSVS